MEFQRPEFLFLLIPIWILFFYSVRSKKDYFRLRIVWDRFEKPKEKLISIPDYIPSIFSYLGLSFLVLATAGPGKETRFLPQETDGIDIMVALDISGSMVNGFDFLPKNRLTVSKELLQSFVSKRELDRIGLVLFAGAAYLQSPLTSDRETLQELIETAEESKIEEQGTAIGDALLLSTFRLKSSKAKNKIILLLTDGVSNTGRMDPETASFTTRSLGIKVYSIGIGKESGNFEINYESLAEISKLTGGQFFRAESPEALESVLSEIDGLEKTPLPAKPLYVRETFFRDYLYYSAIFFGIECLFLLIPFKEFV